MCDAGDLEELIDSHLSSYVQLEGNRVVLVERVHVEQLVQDARSILEKQPACTMDGDQFMAAYSKRYNQDLDLSVVERDLAHMVIVSEDGNTKKKQISLAPLRVFAREIVDLLEESAGFLSVANLESAYLQK